MFYCSKMIYVCETNLSYVYLDSDRVHRQCVTARRECDGISALTLDVLLNCTKHLNATLRYDKSEICKEYPDVENKICPKRNYKVPEFVNITSFVAEQGKLQRMIQENNVTSNCSFHVLNAACYGGFPACTRDEAYAVSLLGKGFCLKVMKCLEHANNTNLTNFATNLCQKLPDEDTAKNISIKDIEIPLVKTSKSPPFTIADLGTSITVPSSKPSQTHTKMRFLTASTTAENNKTTTKAPCCGASSLHTLGLTAIVWLISASFVI
ncbi:uncharacterized protein LOC114531807 [Dendronephthya gigantea]|uniref:uncharacterized protein LOC114531807 n=1 Tax=Dendronephthya gigantea TaxID=151771 RepID=UPI00106C7D34|nr:uncharacterized protein LOC114531807 [Dendronephthya gigantea]